MINKKRIAGAILAGVLTVAGATSAFAADQTVSQPAVNQRQFFKADKTDLSSKVKSAIDNLVSEGTITQAQADAVTKAYTPGEGLRMPQTLHINSISELVTAGTITQAQADSITSAIRTGIASGKTMEDIFKELVTDGTVTEAQKEEIQKNVPDKVNIARSNAKSLIKLESLVDSDIISQEQADAFNTAMKTARASKKSSSDILKELVAAGTITQAQADAFNAAIKSIRESKKSTADVLKDLVSAGTMTQEQADAIQKVFTPFEGKAFSVRLKNNPLDELVTAGTITQEQADAINAAIKSAMSSLNK
ncbi:MAG: hypothetical protein APF77_13040 [Clostridia bacterium BRH_c25]|nr:MAG: hypothetical protein APF77_13040 [Clostridia bacterium BRH_c25]